jgi:anti-anti-sigma regulatory factor
MQIVGDMNSTAESSIIKTSQASGGQPVTILRVLERINLGNAGQLEDAARVAYQEGHRNFLIDLTEVPSITSAGLRAILVIYKLLGSERSNHASPVTSSLPPDPPAKSAYLKLLNVAPEVRKVLRIAGFEDYLEIFNNLDEAIASFEERSERGF